jgi:signal transduction histidine kinase
MDPNKTDEQRLAEAVEAISRVDPDICSKIFAMSQVKSVVEIVNSFNQAARDLFAILLEVSRDNRIDYGMNGYKFMFDSAIKMNARLPLDKFTLVILKHAPEIYDEDEKNFLSMTVPDASVSVGGGFELIKSTSFKNLWLSATDEHKATIKRRVITLTYYAQAYLYKTATAPK